MNVQNTGKILFCTRVFLLEILHCKTPSSNISSTSYRIHFVWHRHLHLSKSEDSTQSSTTIKTLSGRNHLAVSTEKKS